jgi:gliding motility-associated-like protein
MSNFTSSIFILLMTLLGMPHALPPTFTMDQAIIMCDPDFSFTTTPCSQSVNFQATAPIPVSNPNLSFEWDFGDGSPLGMGTIINHTYVAIGGGSMNFTLTVTDASDSCSNSIQKIITIDELPDAALTDNNIFSPFSFCDGDTYTLVVENASTTTSENANYQIDWGDGSMLFTAGSSFTTTNHTYTGQGGYSIVLTVTGTNGCTSTFTQEFYMGGNPAVGISIPSLGNICNSTEVAVNMENWGGNSPGTIYIITSNSSPNPLFTFVHPPPAVVNINFSNSSCGFTSIGGFSDAFHVTVEAINPCGNASATAEPVRVSSPPMAAIQATPPTNSCPDEMFEFCDVSIGANYYISSLGECSEAVIRTWTISPNTFSLLGSTLSDSCLMVSFDVPNTYQLCLEVSNPCDTSSICETVVIAETPIANAQVNSTAGDCAPKTITFDNLSQHQTSNQWMILPLNGWSGNLNVPSPTVTFTGAGIYTVQLIITNLCGTDEWGTTIEINDVPTVNILPISDICEGEQITPTANVEENGCAVTYNWSFPGGMPVSFIGANPPAVSYAVAGQYSVILEATNCCGTTTSTEIFFVTGVTTATATAMLPNGSTCAPTTVELANQAQNSTSEVWTILPLTGWSGNLNLPNPSITITEVGSYTFSYIAQGGCGAVMWDTTIVFQALPTAMIDFENSICVGEQINPTATSNENGCATTYVWTFAGGTPATFMGLNPPAIAYAVSGQYSVTLEATNCCGTTTVTDLVDVTGLTTATATAMLPNGSTCAPTTVELANQAQNSTSEVWTILPLTGWSGNLNLPNPSITITEIGSYTFSYIAQGGCGAVMWDTTMIFQALPTATIDFENSICVGESIIPTIDIIENGCAVTNIEWSFPEGSPSFFVGAVPPPIGYNTSGSNMFSVTLTNCCGQITVSETIEVEDFVIISVTDTIEVCVGDSCVPLEGTPDDCIWTLDGNVVADNEFCPNTVGTYNLVYTCGSTNCPSFDTTTIVVYDLPMITGVPSDITICNNDAPITLIATPDDENTWWLGNGIDSAGVFDASVLGAGGTMIYYHENPITGCINTAEVEITVNEPTALTVAGATFCNISSINLEEEFGVMEAPGESVTWSGNGITNSEDGTFILPANTILPTDFTIFYDFSNTFNCNYTDSVVITIVSLEQADAGADTTLCSEGTYQLMGNFGTSDGVWTNLNSTLSVTSDGLVELEDPSIPIGETPFTFIYTVFGGTTCEVNDEVEITIINLAGADAGDDLYFCATQTTVTLPLGSVPLGDNGEWSGPGIMNPTLGTLDLAVIPVDGFITLTYTVSSGTLNSCMSTDEINVFLTSPPVVDFSYSTPPCVNLPVNFDNQTTGATQYLWSFGDDITSTEMSPNHAYTSSGIFTIIQEAWSINPLTGDLLCISIDSQMIVIPPVPEIDLLVNTFNGCDSTMIYFAGTTISGGGDFELTVGTEIFTNQIPDSVVIAQTADTFDILISLGVTDDCYPTSADTSIIIPSAFNANFALQNFNNQVFVFCPPYEASFVNLSTGVIDSFIVNYANGQSSLNEFIPQIYDNTTDSLLIYQVQLILFNNLCSPDTATLELTIQPYQFESELQTLQVSACEGVAAYFIAQVSPWIDTIIFNPGNGLGSFAILPGDTIAYVYPQGGNFQAILFATDGCGEILDTSQIAILNAPNLDLIMDSQACVNQEIFASLISDGPIVNPAIIFPDTTVLNVFTSYTSTISGLLSVEATALDSISLCPATISNTIIINEYSGGLIEVQVEEKCDQVFVSFGNSIDYIIIDNDIIIEPSLADTSTVITFQEAGIHFLEFVKIDMEGCETNQIISVEAVENRIEVNAGVDTSVFLGQTINLQGVVEYSISPIQINWTANDSRNDIIAPYELLTEVQPIYSGFYTLVVEDANGCQSSDELYVTVKQPKCNGNEEDDIFVPNAFTPNNDGVNEVFLVYAGESVEGVTSFQVFDRWGEKVFAKKGFPPNNPQHGWDGTLNGKPMNSAVFVWYLEVELINGSKYICQGDVTLFR